MASSKRPPALAELVRHGYSEAGIDKLWGRNYLRVFKAVEIKLGASRLKPIDEYPKPS